MVFTSLPPYLDSPHWHQEPNHQLGSTTTASMNENHLDHQQPSPDPLPQQQSSTGSIRPNSMTDRARIAKIPQPESTLKCPRCESTNTKFCYFNNYSLSQPRHFCKTCRRYWTRGGALRNVPVGGGCRRNKRSKGSGSKSSASGAQKGGSSSNTTSTSTNNTTTSLPSNSFTSDAITNMVSPLLPQLPYMTSLHQLHDYGDHMGFSFNTIQPPLVQGNDMDFQMGNCTTPTSAVGGGGGNILSEQWRSQQFPFLSGGSYPFEGDMAAVKMSAPVKMEETQGFNLSREFMSTQGNDQYWGGGVGVGVGNSNAWTDLSGFTSSTATHLL